MNKLSAVLVASLFALSACDKQAADAPADPRPAAAPAQTMPAAAANPALLAPEKATEKAPETFRVKLVTTKGDMVVEVNRAWSPNGADRFYNLVKLGYYDDTSFFRVVGGFMAQIGIHGDPAVSAKWRPATIMDDPYGGQTNARGTLTFAKTGMPNSRTTQIFLSMGNNSFLDSQGFTPFGRIVEGLGVLDQLYNGYGDGPPQGSGVDQGRFQMEGNAYLKAEFPRLDYIKSARLL
jgi:peptidyl-prolyl cis-trans isomerase A (cyclophilin A)